VGKAWRVTGSVWKAGKRIKKVEKTIAITSEEELEAAEREVRATLHEEICKSFKKADFNDIKIEVDSEIEKSDGP
jgi:hypothetical protein